MGRPTAGKINKKLGGVKMMANRLETPLVLGGRPQIQLKKLDFFSGEIPTSCGAPPQGTMIMAPYDMMNHHQ